MSAAAAKIREKMESRGIHDLAIRSFQRAYHISDSGEDVTISEGTLESADHIPKYLDLSPKSHFSPGLIAKTVTIKLNGGLGTGMGLEQAKSLLEVRPGATFLDLMVGQLKNLRATSGENARFLLMNSEATSKDTKEHLSQYADELGDPSDLELMQSWAPKLERSSGHPVSWPENESLEWCPPGHGDIYPSLAGSGWLDRLLKEGVRYAFLSNSDNLGATLDPTLLEYFAGSEAPFLMEVTRRTGSDKKGGHLARRKSDQRLILRELAQCPESDLESFQDIERHQYFNTNNIWLNLEAVKAVMDANEGVLPLPVMTNFKTVDPRDPESTSVIQLEQAMGSAIECFEGAQAIDVPRSRFAPVKTTGDLLALRSDAYELREGGNIELACSREGVPPLVSLSNDYKFVDALTQLGVPSLIQAKKISIEGPCAFEEGVSIEGEVSFSNRGNEVQKIRSGHYHDGQKISW